MPLDFIILIKLGERVEVTKLLIIQSLHPSSVQIFFSTPSSQTPSVYVPPLMSKKTFHAHAEPQAKL
jgi:hypothetical protein